MSGDNFNAGQGPFDFSNNDYVDTSYLMSTGPFNLDITTYNDQFINTFNNDFLHHSSWDYAPQVEFTPMDFTPTPSMDAPTANSITSAMSPPGTIAHTMSQTGGQSQLKEMDQVSTVILPMPEPVAPQPHFCACGECPFPDLCYHKLNYCNSSCAYLLEESRCGGLGGCSWRRIGNLMRHAARGVKNYYFSSGCRGGVSQKHICLCQTIPRVHVDSRKR